MGGKAKPETLQKWREANRERLRQMQRESYARMMARMTDKERADRRERKRKILAAWVERNREHCREGKRERYAKNKEEINSLRRNATPQVKAQKAARQRAYVARNAEAVATRARTRREQTREAHNAAMRMRYATDAEYRAVKAASDASYGQRNRHKKSAYHHAYYLANKEKLISSVHAYYQKNRESIIAQKRQWVQNNRARARKIARDKDARKRGAKGSHTYAQWVARIDYYGWRCFYCNCQLTKDSITQDHAMPLARGGTNFAANLLPACRKCNSSKNKKTVFEFVAWRARTAK